MGLNTSEWIIILVIVLIFFGAGKLPDVFRQAGKGIRAFKDASEGKDEEDEKETAEEKEERLRRREKKKQLAARDDLDDDPEEERAASAKKKEAR